MKRNRALFFLLAVLAVLTSGQSGSPAIASSLSNGTQIQSTSPDSRFPAETPITHASTCEPAADGQGTGIVFRHQIKGKTVVLNRSSYAAVSTDEISSDDSLEKVLPANNTLYHSNDNFRQSIDSLLAPYIGDGVHSADLKVIQDEVSLLYSQNGYITSWSDCVELQDDGTLVIHVTEGFINYVNVGRISENPPIYLPAEKTTLGREVLEYVAPVLLDSNGLPQRPINLAQLEYTLQALSKDPRFASPQTFSRLRLPTQSFLDRSIAMLQEYLQDAGQLSQYSSTPIESLINQLEDKKKNGALHLDTLAPGASILEIDLKVRADDLSATEEDPYLDRVVPSARV